MNKAQETILNLSRSRNLKDMTLREIATLIGSPHAQVARYHINQLQRKGMLNDRLEPVSRGEGGTFLSIPIYGAANCGVATHFADHHIDGYLRVSPSVVRGYNAEQLIAIRADGVSMDRANIQGKSIETGDYAIVDTANRNPDNNEYVVSVIDGVANIKKFRKDSASNQIVLISESSQEFPPIIIHDDDLPDYSIAGKVVQVIKQVK